MFLTPTVIPHINILPTLRKQLTWLQNYLKLKLFYEKKNWVSSNTYTGFSCEIRNNAAIQH